MRWVEFQPVKLQHAVIYITERCNSRCRTCRFWTTQDEVPLPASEWKRVIQDLRALGIAGIEFAGGEPLLYSGISDLINAAKEFGFSTITLSTNGGILSEDQKLIRELVNHGVNNFHISLDGLKETYRFIRGVDWFDRILEIVSEIRASNASVLVLTTLTRLCIDELTHLVAAVLKAGGTWSVNLLENRKYGFKGVNIESLTIRDAVEIQRVVDTLKSLRSHYGPSCRIDRAVISYIQEYLKDVSFEKNIPCTIGFRDIYLNPKADVFTACMSLPAVGNAINTPLDQIIQSSRFKSNLKTMLVRHCSGCTCGFGQRAALMYRTPRARPFMLELPHSVRGGERTVSI